MCSKLIYPKDYHRKLPHIRISKKKYLALENQRLFFVFLGSDFAIFTPIAYYSDLLKFTVKMSHSKNGSILYLKIYLRNKSHLNYRIRSQKKIRYTYEDWAQIPIFLRKIDFIPDQNTPKGIPLEDIKQSFHVTGPYRFFAEDDHIFELYQNPEFAAELKQVKLPIFYSILLPFLIFGFFASIIFVIFHTDIESWYLWLSGGLTFVMSLIFIRGVSQYVQKRKILIEKYNIEYYF